MAMTVPDCECHGLPKYWSDDTRYTAGGYWRCAEAQRARVRARYHADPEYKREWQQRRRAQPGNWAKELMVQRRALAVKSLASRPPVNPKFAAALIAVKRKGESSSRSTGQKTS